MVGIFEQRFADLMINMAPSVLDDDAPYLVGVGKEYERLQIREEQELSGACRKPAAFTPR